MARLRTNPENSARALELAILCASRPSEVLNARRSEFNLDAATWIIPGRRMKGGREHRVPLAPCAVKLLASLPRVGECVFVGRGEGPPHRTTLLLVLRRMGITEASAHGFRSSFRDWATECTQYPNHVIEMALAHQIPSAVERAYRRGDLLDQRRQLMKDWSDFLASA
jgi:integrase